MVGGRDYYDDALQPRHQRRAPARLVVQGLRPRRRARGRHLARLDLDVQAEGIHRPRHPRQGKVRRAQRRRQLHGLQHADRRHGLLRQLDLRRSRAQSRHQADRAARAPDGHHDAALDQPGDDDRRPHRRRHAARHGPRLRDDRPRRAARQRHARRARRSPWRSRKSTPARTCCPTAPTTTSTTSQTKPCCRRASPRPRPRCSRPCVQYGTGKAAAIGQFAAGKTGTTSNYGDAWFVGWDSKYTVAVWVGYPDKLVPMTTELQRRPRARRHLPGADLARLHDLRAGDRQDTRRTKRPPARSRSRRSGRRRITTSTDRPVVAQRSIGQRAQRRRIEQRRRHKPSRLRRAAAKPSPHDRTNRPARPPEKSPGSSCAAKRRRTPSESTPPSAADTAVAAPAASARAASSPCAGPARALYGRGRETFTVAAAQKRQGSSTAV